MKKKSYKKPDLQIQRFVPNEFCTVCATDHYLVLKANIMSIEGGNLYYESNGIPGFQQDEYYPERIIGDQQVAGAQDQVNIPERYTKNAYLVVRDLGKPGYYWNNSPDPINKIVKDCTIVYAMQFYNDGWHADTNSWYAIEPGASLVAEKANHS